MNDERRPQAPPVQPLSSVAVLNDAHGPRSSWTAKDLVSHQFPELTYAVPGVLTEGLSLLAGSPKLGKSWLALNIATAIAFGGVVLDSVNVERGEVLYLALEDPPRRLQRRLQLVLGGNGAPDGLHFETQWPRLLEGGYERLDDWLRAHQDCRLVVVDVFAKVRGIVAGNANRYELDYAAMTSLKEIADRHGIAILVIHHTRKAAADDYVDSVSGTHGLAGAADAVLVLRRSRGSADAKLQVTGRDVEEVEYAMKFHPAEGAWSLLEGPAEEYELGDTRRRILHHLRENGPATPKAIAEELRIEHDAAKQACLRMARDGQLGTDGSGVYSYLSPLSPVSPESDSDDRSDGTMDTSHRILVFGDAGYLDYVADVHRNGHVTTGEALELESWHKLVLEARAA